MEAQATPQIRRAKKTQQWPGAVLSILPEPPGLDRFLLTPASKTGVAGPPQEAQPSRGRPSRQVRPLGPLEQTPRPRSPGALKKQPEAPERTALWEL